MRRKRLSGRQIIQRASFWLYCQRAALRARDRARRCGFPCDVEAHDLDALLVDQGWQCAVSGIALMRPGAEVEPFGPSIDRIVPALGYVKGNVRVVCNMANFAMNRWGEKAMREFVNACRTSGQQHPRQNKAKVKIPQ